MSYNVVSRKYLIWYEIFGEQDPSNKQFRTRNNTQHLIWIAVFSFKFSIIIFAVEMSIRCIDNKILTFHYETNSILYHWNKFEKIYFYKLCFHCRSTKTIFPLDVVWSLFKTSYFYCFLWNCSVTKFLAHELYISVSKKKILYSSYWNEFFTYATISCEK